MSAHLVAEVLAAKAVETLLRRQNTPLARKPSQRY